MRTGPKPRPEAERFWAQVEKQPGPDGCWLWTATCRVRAMATSVFAFAGYRRPGPYVEKAQLKAMIDLLGPDEMTPTAKRQLLKLVGDDD